MTNDPETYDDAPGDLDLSVSVHLVLRVSCVVAVLGVNVEFHEDSVVKEGAGEDIYDDAPVLVPVHVVRDIAGDDGGMESGISLGAVQGVLDSSSSYEYMLVAVGEAGRRRLLLTS